MNRENMNEGLLYRVDDGDDLLTALRRAATAYVRRTGTQPELCHAAPDTVAKLAIISPDLTIVADDAIAPDCLWIGRRTCAGARLADAISKDL